MKVVLKLCQTEGGGGGSVSDTKILIVGSKLVPSSVGYSKIKGLKSAHSVKMCGIFWIPVDFFFGFLFKLHLSFRP